MTYIITDTMTKDVYPAKTVGEAFDAVLYILGGQELTEYEQDSLTELFDDLSDNIEDDVFDYTESLDIRVVVTR